MLLNPFPSHVHRTPLQGFPCSLQNGNSCLVVLAQGNLFAQPERLQGVYQAMLLRYPHSLILLLEEEEGAASRYYGHPLAEAEIFLLRDQLKSQRLAPLQACFLPVKSA